MCLQSSREGQFFRQSRVSAISSTNMKSPVSGMVGVVGVGCRGGVLGWGRVRLCLGDSLILNIPYIDISFNNRIFSLIQSLMA